MPLSVSNWTIPAVMGQYSCARSLPTGNYQVTIKHADGTVSETRSASLRVGATAFIPADPAPAATPVPPPAAAPVRETPPRRP